MNTHDIGDVVRCSGAFTDSDGAAQDPGGVTFEFQDPSENEVIYTYGTDAELVKDSTGNYHVDLTIDEAGYWYYRFNGVTTGVSGGEGVFAVRESEF
jgi:hypothetical protein